MSGSGDPFLREAERLIHTAQDPRGALTLALVSIAGSLERIAEHLELGAK